MIGRRPLSAHAGCQYHASSYFHSFQWAKHCPLSTYLNLTCIEGDSVPSKGSLVDNVVEDLSFITNMCEVKVVWSLNNVLSREKKWSPPPRNLSSMWKVDFFWTLWYVRVFPSSNCFPAKMPSLTTRISENHDWQHYRPQWHFAKLWRKSPNLRAKNSLFCEWWLNCFTVAK